MKAAILGTTGYTGLILLRLLAEHDDVDVFGPAEGAERREPVGPFDELDGRAPGLRQGEVAVERRPPVVRPPRFLLLLLDGMRNLA